MDLPLQLVYMKQLTLLREKALQKYKTLAKGSETSDYQVWRHLLVWRLVWRGTWFLYPFFVLLPSGMYPIPVLYLTI